MKEGTVSVPSYDPCAKSDGDVLPVQGYRIREATAAGVNPPVSVKIKIIKKYRC